MRRKKRIKRIKLVNLELKNDSLLQFFDVFICMQLLYYLSHVHTYTRTTKSVRLLNGYINNQHRIMTYSFFIHRRHVYRCIQYSINCTYMQVQCTSTDMLYIVLVHILVHWTYMYSYILYCLSCYNHCAYIKSPQIRSNYFCLIYKNYLHCSAARKRSQKFR